MIEEIRALVDECQVWPKDENNLRELGDWVGIGLPYMDRHNDYLAIYAGRDGDDWVLHDAGYIIDDLSMSGCHLDTPERLSILNKTIRGFGVYVDGETNALTVRASRENFVFSFHRLTQVMLAVDNLAYIPRGPEGTALRVADPPPDANDPTKTEPFHSYEIHIHWDTQHGHYVAETPDLPAFSARGDTKVEALQCIEQAIQDWLDEEWEAKKHGQSTATAEAERLVPAAVD